MLLRYTNAEGKLVEAELGSRDVTIGRDPAADIAIPSEKASRFHCAIRFWEGDYVLKDLKSRNGTYVNDARVDVAILKHGDAIRVGASVLACVKKSAKGTTTVIRELGEEMEEGKGYNTILREIVEDVGEQSNAKAPPQATE